MSFNNHWYIFYHEAVSETVMHLRRMEYAELHYNADGTIQTINP